MMNTIIFITLAVIQTASNKPVTIAAHPDCEDIQFDEKVTSYQVGNIVCIDADKVYKDQIFVGNFDD